MAKFNKTRRSKKQSKPRRKTMKRSKKYVMRGGWGKCPANEACFKGGCYYPNGNFSGSYC